MIRWVPFSEINAWHLQHIAKSLQAMSASVRPSERDFVQQLAGGVLRLFEYDGGIVVCHAENNILWIDATSCEKVTKVWKLLPWLKKLAADWLCDTIQTTVFSRQLADAIVKLGGRIESYDLVLGVERADEQED